MVVGLTCWLIAQGSMLTETEATGQSASQEWTQLMQKQLAPRWLKAQEINQQIKGQIATLSPQRFSALSELASQTAPYHFSFFLYRDKQLFYWSESEFVLADDWHNDWSSQALTLLPDKEGLLLTDSLNGGENAFHWAIWVPLKIWPGGKSSRQNAVYAWPELAYTQFIPSPLPVASYQVQLDKKAAVHFLPTTGSKKGVESEISIERIYLGLLSWIFLVWALLDGIHFHLTLKRHYQRGFVLLVLGLYVLTEGLCYPLGLGWSSFLSVSSPLQQLWPIWPLWNGVSTDIQGFGLVYWLLQTISLVIMAGYLFRYFPGSRLYLQWVNSRSMTRLILGILVVIGFQVLILMLYQQLRLLHGSLGEALDLSAPIDLGANRALGMLALMLLAALLFFTAHVQLRTLLALTQNKSRLTLQVLAIGTLLFALVWYVGLSGRYLPLLVIDGLFLGVVLLNRWPKYLNIGRIESFRYLLAFTCLFGVLTGYALRNELKRRDWSEKHRFAYLIERQSDVTVEEVLDSLQRKLTQSPVLKEWALDITQNQPLLEKRVKAEITALELQKFAVDMVCFGANNKSLDSSQTPLEQYRQRFMTGASRTRFASVFFSKSIEQGSYRQYLTWIPFQLDNQSLGGMLLILRERNTLSNSPLPALLTGDPTSMGSDATRAYSYAIYQGETKAFNSGNFNYDRYFKPAFVKDERLIRTGLTIQGFSHLGIPLSRNRLIIVSQPIYPVKNLISHSCFVTILLALSLLLILAILSWHRGQWKTLTLATKIQLSLNTAFILPLVLITILAVSVMGSTYRSDLQSSFVLRSEQVARMLLPALEQEDPLKKVALITTEVSAVGRSMTQDLHLFGPNGQLLATSQPLLFQKRWVSRYANPEALASVIEARQNAVLLPEQIGELRFKTAYAAIRVPETGKVLGLVALPYFESDTEIRHQIQDLVSSMLIFFTAMAFLLAIGSHWASQQLVVPLRLLIRQIRRTSLERNPAPLQWKSQDEIGLLVTEYNNMLAKLGRSREALILSEKESAWREMARQVAHEIKNPLTPMKLSLQYLEQAISQGHPEVSKITQKSIKTLLTQIEALSDIATSFSAFAQMPVPKLEPVDLTEVCRQTATLYSQALAFEQSQEGPHPVQLLTKSLPDDPLPIIGDGKLLSRILTNLILNAFQSVPSDREALVHLTLTRDGQQVIISVKDNGTGIEEEIGPKIFRPNFSTKSGGSGIGLAVAKRGIEHMGGTIWFDTNPDEGSCFYIKLPLVEGS